MQEQDDQDARLFDCDPFDLARRMLDDADAELVRPADFGPYHFLGDKPIGTGTLGDVWLAEEHGADRRVAVKFLRRVSQADLAANEIKNQGKLEHRYIARLYNYDIPKEGTPWLAVEYVDGQRLDAYCLSQNCTVDQRLRLFHAVCEAVRYAHVEGVGHGDLKPSNILIKNDGEPKLLDFGLARRVHTTEDGSTEAPETLGFTPAYAAPEQFLGESAGFRSDVYSLGVILYELLVGELPFNASKHTFAEIESFKVGFEKPDAPSVAGRRKTGVTPARNADRQLSEAAWRDLDALCLKAMERDVNLRYSSVEALLQDLDRYMRDEPLAARVPYPRGYRFGKFVKRNRSAVVSAGIVFAAIIIMATFFTVRLTRERNKAVAEAARTQRVEEFMENLFQGGETEVGPSQDLRVVTILDRGVKDAQTLTADPKIQADFYQTLGSVYQSLGQLERAESLLQSALAIRRATVGPDHEETGDTLLKLGALRLDQGQMSEAERLIRQALAIFQRRLAPDHTETVEATMLLGRVLEQNGAYDQAIQTLNSAIKLLSQKGAPSKGLSASLTLLANVYFYRGDYARADLLNRQALAIDQQLYGTHHPNLADDFINLGQVQTQWGHYPEAEKFFRQALEINQAWYGKDSAQAADAATYVAQSLEFQSREGEAEDLLKDALAALERTYGKVHPRVAIALGSLGAVAKDLNKLDEAEADFRREFEIFRSVYGDDHQHTAIALSNLASVYLAKRQLEKADQGFRDVIRRFGRTVPSDNLNIGIARIKLGDTLVGEKRYEEAEGELILGSQIVTKTDPSATWIKTARGDLITVYVALKQPEKAAKVQQELAVSEPKKDSGSQVK